MTDAAKYETNADPASSEKRSDTELYADDVLIGPPSEETLHRGLKARQISMIAVSIELQLVAVDEWSSI
jgi:hypothetical protein